MKKLLSLALALALVLALAAPAAAHDAHDDHDVTEYPLFFSNANTDGVTQGGVICPGFTVDDTDVYVQAISTYHYNGGAGAAPGWIGLYDFASDKCIGRWRATAGGDGLWWDVFPGIVLEGGRSYYIRTSGDGTWSHNAGSEGCGFVEIFGYETEGDVHADGDGSIPPSRQTAGVEVMVNGAYVQWTDAWPFIDENNRTMVPLRAVAEAMGLTAAWNGSAREASFTDGSRAIYFPIGSRTARSGGGGEIPMDTTAVIRNRRTYAPVRYMAEFFGFDVDWDGARRTVLISGYLEPTWDPALDGVDMWVERSAFAQGETIEVHYTGIQDSMLTGGCWIGIGPRGTEGFNYLYGERPDRFSGTVELTAPDLPGLYELRFYRAAAPDTALGALTLWIEVT